MKSNSRYCGVGFAETEPIRLRGPGLRLFPGCRVAGVAYLALGGREDGEDNQKAQQVRRRHPHVTATKHRGLHGSTLEHMGLHLNALSTRHRTLDTANDAKTRWQLATGSGGRLAGAGRGSGSGRPPGPTLHSFGGTGPIPESLSAGTRDPHPALPRTCHRAAPWPMPCTQPLSPSPTPPPPPPPPPLGRSDHPLPALPSPRLSGTSLLLPTMLPSFVNIDFFSRQWVGATAAVHRKNDGSVLPC